jgi:hypothetical protein
VLGFDRVLDGDEVLRDLVLARIIEPTRKIDVERVLTETGVTSASYGSAMRRLAVITKPSVRQALSNACETLMGAGAGQRRALRPPYTRRSRARLQISRPRGWYGRACLPIPYGESDERVTTAPAFTVDPGRIGRRSARHRLTRIEVLCDDVGLRFLLKVDRGRARRPVKRAETPYSAGVEAVDHRVAAICHRPLPPAVERREDLLHHKHDLQARPVDHHTRESIHAHATIGFAALAVSHWIENQTGWTVKKFVRTPCRYRTVEIDAGKQTLTVAEQFNLSDVFNKIGGDGVH